MAATMWAIANSVNTSPLLIQSPNAFGLCNFTNCLNYKYSWNFKKKKFVKWFMSSNYVGHFFIFLLYLLLIHYREETDITFDTAQLPQIINGSVVQTSKARSTRQTSNKNTCICGWCGSDMNVDGMFSLPAVKDENYDQLISYLKRVGCNNEIIKDLIEKDKQKSSHRFHLSNIYLYPIDTKTTPTGIIKINIWNEFFSWPVKKAHAALKIQTWNWEQ